MIGGTKVKICGLTSLADAQAAAEVGADYLGFIFYPKSPRFLSDEKYTAMHPHLPEVKKVAVCVEPTQTGLAALAELGFDYFQVHYSNESGPHALLSWAETVGPDRLWLAPKLPPQQDVEPEWLSLAETFLLDTFHPDKFGGTGKTGDWAKFKRHQEKHPKKTWILSGGLSPANIAEAVRASGAKFVDVNSGVESSPGVKDPAKLKALAAALR
ncbi:MAG TPA: phosphoribosylanthranilate isomerase [Candidatus Didemnitutus sp.]|nr:phosphoribosylanthranilate isomerase [Candidatus Didemnitutus sp.]